jgi:hypothetical protein
MTPNEQKIVAICDHVQHTGILPPRTGEGVARFSDGTNMRAWWIYYRATCKMSGATPDRRVLASEVLHNDWLAYTAAAAPKMSEQHKIVAFRDHVQSTGELPGYRGGVEFGDSTNMRAWWDAYTRRCRNGRATPDSRLLGVDAIRVNWDQRNRGRTDCTEYINTFVDRVVETGRVPRRGDLDTFRDGVSMGRWWSMYMRKRHRDGTVPCNRLMRIPHIRTSWVRRQRAYTTST